MGCLFSHSERMIRVPIPKEHPYQSHISRFALFPTFRSPDDPDTGVRAASQRPLNPLVPASAPQVTVLRKTKGRGPYRHEVLQAPKAMRKSTITWPGQHGFLDHPRPVTGDAETQVFYPMALKSVFPNPSLRDWGVTLSERTANTLHNLEKSLWATSYQLDFTGAQCRPPTHKPHPKWHLSLPQGSSQRERSHPILLPPKPGDGRKARIGQERRVLQSTDPPPTVNSAAESQPAALTSHHGRSGPLGALTHHNRSGPLGGYGYNETLVNDFTQDYRLPNNSQNHTEPSLDIEIQDQKRQNREITEIPCSISNPCIQPRPPVLPSTQPGEGGGVLAGGGNAPNCRHQSSLLELQDSFSKSEVHRRFRSSLQGGPVNLQDNVHAGRKHHFYGFNSYYFHD
uniref:Uncharacterized protein n=1 Tax=Esox lucius TaxID=8010 RepID=A0A6Q2YCT5_ESOLU